MKMEGYRKEVAESLRGMPKEDRAEAHAVIQKSDEYWKARTEKLLGGQKAEFVEDRTSFRWGRKNVYHGTDTSGIDEFNFAEESTIGNNAVYFTLDPTAAIGYAKLRARERSSKESHLYEAVLSDVNIMNWAEPRTVEKLAKDFGDFCLNVKVELHELDYGDFVQKYKLTEGIQKSTVEYALKNIENFCEQPGSLHGGNIKVIAQGLMGVFFEMFVKDNGCDGVITVEGGDDLEFTAKSAVSVVVFNKEKIVSHRAVDVTPVHQ